MTSKTSGWEIAIPESLAWDIAKEEVGACSRRTMTNSA